jgi:hypothetical protein
MKLAEQEASNRLSAQQVQGQGDAQVASVHAEV